MLTTYEKHNGSQCKPTKDQKAINACPSNVCSCYAYAVREEEDAKMANAQLIAAAPEMLEALQTIIKAYKAYDGGLSEEADLFEAIGHADGIIHKAQGIEWAGATYNPEPDDLY